MISLALTLYQFNWHFYIDIESNTPILLTSSIYLSTIVLSSLNGSIVSPTPIDTLGKLNQKLILFTVFMKFI